jgi:hypothetical protein
MSNKNIIPASSHRLAIATAVAAAILAAPTNAQPPAQGPAPASSNPANEIEALVLTELVGYKVNQTVAKENQQLSGIWSAGSLSWSGTELSPYVIPTVYPDRPNEFYADLPYNLSYTYSIAGYSLTISQSTDIQVFCEGWQNGSGVTTIKAVFGSPYFDPNQFSWLSSVAQIPSLTASKIDQELASIPSGTFPIPLGGGACASLGVRSKAQGGAYDSVIYDTPAPRPVSWTPPNMTVRVVQITRIPNGGEYSPVETPYLSLWAFYSNLHLQLPAMVEGQTYTPTTNAVIQTPVPSVNGQLVLIASMSSARDSTWAEFGYNTYFGSGAQNLITPKTWSEILPGSYRPIWVTANGYQVTLQISLPTATPFPGNL